MPVTFMGHASFCGGTSHRLSIALNLSGLGEDQVAINLRTEQPGDAYKGLHPRQLVSALDIGGAMLTQCVPLQGRSRSDAVGMGSLDCLRQLT